MEPRASHVNAVHGCLMGALAPKGVQAEVAWLEDRVRELVRPGREKGQPQGWAY